MNIKKFLAGTVAGVLMLGALAVPAFAADDVLVSILYPSWEAIGGGGVYSAYYGPLIGDLAVSPGVTTVYDGRESGIIKAGLAFDPSDGIYWDQGLFAFKVPNVDISAFAGQTLSYVVQNETGTNPVWVRIRLTNGTQYQFVPTTNPTSWHTVDAATEQWQLMDGDGNATGPLMTLSEVATANLGVKVDRVYLTLGMGNSYNVEPGVGTVAWVDKVTIGGVTYDFVVAPTTKDECKEEGWESFESLTFKNQGECVSYVQSNENAGKRE